MSVSKQITAPQAEDKESMLFMADIDECSELNLSLENIQEVVGISATPRKQFNGQENKWRDYLLYKGVNTIQWPLHHVLKKSFKTLSNIFFNMRRI